MAAAGGFLVDAETRLNPAAASTYFGASGGPQSAGGMPPSDMSRGHRTIMSPAAHREQEAHHFPQEDLKNIEQLPEEDRKPANAQSAYVP